MATNLPSHSVPLSLVADIITYINKNPNTSQKEICSYTGKSESYVRSGICIGRLLGIINNEGFKVDEFADTLGTTPNRRIEIKCNEKISASI